MPDLQNLGWFAILGTLAAFWRQLLSLAQRLRSFFVTQTTVKGDAADALSAYCWKHFRRTPFGDRYYISGSRHVRPLNRMQEVAWERPPKQPLIFFDGWRPILLGGMGYRDNHELDSNFLTLTTIRRLVDVEDLIAKALDYLNEQQSTSSATNRRFCVHRVQGYIRRQQGNLPGGATIESPASAPKESSSHSLNRYIRWTIEDIGMPITENPMAAIALPAEVMDAVEEFRRWKRSEQWFRERGIPWRRGWCLHGKPGTGKTTLVRAIAQLEDMPIWNFDLSSLSNKEMFDAWNSMRESAPCIALIEDIDGVFHGRENVTGEQGGGLTFDCLLQCLSGIETADGVFVIITTNHLDKIDEALGVPRKRGDTMGETSIISSRPGRLDRVIEMPLLDDVQRQAIASRILGDWPDLIANMMDQGSGLTGAQFTEICVKHALARYWEDKSNTQLAPNHYANHN